MCFRDTNTKKIASENPDKSHKEVMQLVGAAWKKLTDPEKEIYKKMSEDDVAARAAGAAPVAPKAAPAS